MARTIIIEPGQVLEDIALQVYGHIDGVTWLLLDNESVLPNGFSSTIAPGLELELRDDHVDRAVYALVTKARIIPSTGEDEELASDSIGDHNNDFNNDHH